MFTQLWISSGDHTETISFQKYPRTGPDPPVTSSSCSWEVSNSTRATDWLLHRHLSNHYIHQLALTDLKSSGLRINKIMLHKNESSDSCRMIWTLKTNDNKRNDGFNCQESCNVMWYRRWSVISSNHILNLSFIRSMIQSSSFPS